MPDTSLLPGRFVTRYFPRGSLRIKVVYDNKNDA